MRISSGFAGWSLVGALVVWVLSAAVVVTLASDGRARLTLLGVFGLVALAVGTDLLQSQRILSRHAGHAEALEALAAAVQALHLEFTRRAAWADEPTMPMRLVDLGQVVDAAVATVRATATVQPPEDDPVSLLEHRLKRQIQNKELPEGS